MDSVLGHLAKYGPECLDIFIESPYMSTQVGGSWSIKNIPFWFDSYY
jgi:hypothetical protein